MKRVLAIGCFLTLFAGELAAMVPPVALARTAALFTAGRFLEAVEAGRHLGTPEALALAARASACRATHLATASARLEGFRDTARLARAALSRDPANREARLQLVIALGYLARAETAIDAHLAGYADEARRHLEVAIERGSVTPWAWAVLGAWHAEIISRAGPALGRSLYGANARSAVVNFERAVRAEPTNLIIHYEFARALMRLDPAENAARARKQLNLATALSPRNACERLFLRQAYRFRTVMGLGDRQTVEAALMR